MIATRPRWLLLAEHREALPVTETAALTGTKPILSWELQQTRTPVPCAAPASQPTLR
jgi:hypothetical protein